MAVYTKITKEEIVSHLRNYSIGELIDFKEVIEGIDNSNFILETAKGKFILTIFEERIDKNALPFFISFKLHLAKKGISCPAPILDDKGLAIVEIKNKKSVIVSFLQGKSVEVINANHCFELGKFLAKMHLSAADFSMKRENDLGIRSWRPLFSKFEHLLENYQKNLRVEILEDLDFLENFWNCDLPSATTHLDLFPDNVFFDETGKISGVIDFYFSANEALVYDFAVSMVAWCDDEEKFLQFFGGYEMVRKFSEAEKDFLKIALVGAAMRFLLTRLHDMFFTPKDSLVKIKDPQEYLRKLRFFKSQI